MRLAFVGAGHWHFAVDASWLALAHQAGVEIVGLHDDDENVARARAETAGCPWTTDLAAVVEQFKPDVLVAMPKHDRAAAQLSALLELGVPIFAEKQLGLNAGEVWPLVEPAERGWVTVALPQRYQAIWGELRRMDEEGRLGNIGHINARFVMGPPSRYTEWGVPWMLDPRGSGRRTAA